MPKIVALQKVADGVGIVLDCKCWLEGGTVQVFDALELMAERKKWQDEGAREEQQRLNAMEREREVHAELVQALSQVRTLLAKIEAGNSKLRSEIESTIESTGDGEMAF